MYEHNYKHWKCLPDDSGKTGVGKLRILLVGDLGGV